MKDQDKTKEELSELRRRAEVAAAEKSLGISDVSALSPEKIQQLIHELQVHQIDLEMQNEELRRTQEDLEKAQHKYFELYKLAPLGYFVLDQDGVILEANLSGSAILGTARGFLIGKPLASFVSKEDGDALYLHLTQVLETQSRQSCDIRLIKNDGSQVPLMLESLPIRGQDGSPSVFRTLVTDITRRKGAEDALLASESRCRRLFESARDGILIVDFDTGKILDVNRYLIDMLGYSHEEFLDKYLWEISPFKDTALNKAAFAELLQKGYIRHEDLPIETSDGRSMNVEVVSNSHLVCGVTFIQCNIHDITERKKAEEARLRFLERQERLNYLLQALLAPGELVQKLKMITDGVVDIFGTDFCRIWRISPGDLCERGCVHATVTEEPHVCKYRDKCLHLLASSGRYTHTDGLTHRRVPFGVNKIGRVASGQEHKFLINDVVHAPEVHNHDWARELSLESFAGYQLRPPRGETLGVLALFSKRVITQDEDTQLDTLSSTTAQVIHAAESAERLAESDKQYRTLFEESIDGVYSVLKDGTITHANPSFCELFGYTREEMMGKNTRELYLDPADRPRFQKEIEKKGFVKDYEVKSRKRDGKEVDCSLTSSVLFGKDGSITGYRGIVRDLTAQKALQRQLQQAQKMEAVGTLAGGIAHDFNNILQVVLGYSELVLFDVDMRDQFRDDLGKVLVAGRSGADLVQRLLTFSRKVEPKPLNLDLNQRIRQTHKFLERTIPKMIDIEMILADDLARIYADPTQMDQVLMNLAVNARDAMPEGGSLVIETANVFLDEESDKALLGVKPGEYVLLSMSDTGHGMDKETLGHIFEPFYTTKEAGRGTGLGLAVVYGIVQQHGGYITCYSEPGEGTTFQIYFPAIEMEMNPDVGTSGEMPAFGTETILLVDDEEFVRDLGKRILERSGYTVLTAANGKEALELYRREKETISLVILDLIMPKMGGKQCLEELLKIDPQVKTLIASGFAANGQTKEAFEKGARGFVDKPYKMKEMLQAVREVLDSD